MNDDELWAAIDHHRGRTADLLDDLSDDDWRRPSLCDGWTVRDVAAHLTLQQLGLGDLLREAFRHPAGLNTIIRESARRKAAAPTDQLIAEIRAMVGSRRTNFGVTAQETLIDILVHSLDIAVPLGRRLEMSPAVTAAALTRIRSYRGKSKARVFRPLPTSGLTLTATDIAWTDGSGPEVRGPIAALLMLATGRRAALDELSGAPVAALRDQM
ncbi:maleylpyruvate isomerase family mycothiol-dependent enzyme [Aldersonia kunmingensis]|uniref:maleylpyruvate isomerase family mycothiol-dependent enzyme n=1 Tax=Aldersonia kunmingensis TaxID=408066 RepID=UPI0008326B24|nr:maleylpyruvate isomerase family mycothiol-dependent enzyme [Aldersonia kunmingensis]